MGETLFLAHRVPFPPDRGDKIRSFHVLRALAKLGPVHVGTFDDHSGYGDEFLSGIAASHRSSTASILAGSNRSASSQ